MKISSDIRNNLLLPKNSNSKIEYEQYLSILHHFIKLVLEQSRDIGTCKGTRLSVAFLTRLYSLFIENYP